MATICVIHRVCVCIPEPRWGFKGRYPLTHYIIPTLHRSVPIPELRCDIYWVATIHRISTCSILQQQIHFASEGGDGGTPPITGMISENSKERHRDAYHILRNRATVVTAVRSANESSEKEINIWCNFVPDWVFLAGPFGPIGKDFAKCKVNYT